MSAYTKLNGKYLKKKKTFEKFLHYSIGSDSPKFSQEFLWFSMDRYDSRFAEVVKVRQSSPRFKFAKSLSGVLRISIRLSEVLWSSLKLSQIL